VVKMPRKKKKKGYRIRYQTITVTLPEDPRKGICEACGKSVHKGEIRTTHMHHWVYQYMPKTVRQNPELALKNTSELCYYCHEIADALRALFSDKAPKAERIFAVAKLIPFDRRKKVLNILRKLVKLLEEDINQHVEYATEVMRKVIK